MEQLWSMSTTLREAERIIGFAKTAFTMKGETWNHDTQKKYQILLIKNRYYLRPDNTQAKNGLNDTQVRILENLEYKMTYEEAEGIFNAKNYTDPAMRGRQSLSPLKKLGLVYIKDGIIFCTGMCIKLINEEISLEEFMFESLIKYQYPNPLESAYQDWNIKPFIGLLILIKRVNELCVQQKIEPKGITKVEFGIFMLSLKNYKKINDVAQKIIEFRMELDNKKEQNEKAEYIERYINENLNDFNNPQKNCFEYTDNMIRYIRLTKYIHLRGAYNNVYIDLEPRRLTEINEILEKDNGKAMKFKSEEEWINYIGVLGSYKLPFEEEKILESILNDVYNENVSLSKMLGIEEPKMLYERFGVNDLKKSISVLRDERTKLQNLKIKKDYHENLEKIEETCENLRLIITRRSDKKLSIELEKWANIALNVINDAITIKPNTIVGDDNEPIFTAPAGVADIECYYENFNSICEVTMLTGRDQWYNEGQPVMRHLRKFEDKHNDKNAYCLFIAPKLHEDTLNTFHSSVTHMYNGRKQLIVPITIGQLSILLGKIKLRLERKESFKHYDLLRFFNSCCELKDIVTIEAWQNKIKESLDRI